MENLSKEQRKAMIKALPRVPAILKSTVQPLPANPCDAPFYTHEQADESACYGSCRCRSPMILPSTGVILEITGEDFVYPNSKSKKKNRKNRKLASVCHSQTQLEMMLADVETELRGLSPKTIVGMISNGRQVHVTTEYLFQTRKTSACYDRVLYFFFL